MSQLKLTCEKTSIIIDQVNEILLNKKADNALA